MKKIKCFRFGLLAVGAVFTLVHSSASAALEQSQIVDYGSASDPVAGGNTVNLAFDSFNPSLGTLNEILITLTSVDTVQAEVLNLGSAPGAYSNVMVSGGMETVSALDGLSTSTSTLSAGPFSGTATGTLTIAGTGSQTLSASAQVSPANFSWYTGGPGTFDVSVITGTATSSGTGGNLAFGWNANSYGTVELDYFYSVVPEAGTLVPGLAIFGFAGIYLVRRAKTVYA